MCSPAGGTRRPARPRRRRSSRRPRRPRRRCSCWQSPSRRLAPCRSTSTSCTAGCAGTAPYSPAAPPRPSAGTPRRPAAARARARRRPQSAAPAPARTSLRRGSSAHTIPPVHRQRAKKKKRAGASRRCSALWPRRRHRCPPGRVRRVHSAPNLTCRVLLASARRGAFDVVAGQVARAVKRARPRAGPRKGVDAAAGHLAAPLAALLGRTRGVGLPGRQLQQVIDAAKAALGAAQQHLGWYRRAHVCGRHVGSRGRRGVRRRRHTGGDASGAANEHAGSVP